MVFTAVGGNFKNRTFYGNFTKWSFVKLPLGRVHQLSVEVLSTGRFVPLCLAAAPPVDFQNGVAFVANRCAKLGPRKALPVLG